MKDRYQYIYLLKEVWTNSLENDAGRAIGYEIKGAVTSEDLAKTWADERSGNVTREESWVVGTGLGDDPYIYPYREYEEVRILPDIEVRGWSLPDAPAYPMSCSVVEKIEP